MSSPTQVHYRPRQTGNPAIDEALRKTFDYIYSLGTQVTGLSTATATPRLLSQVQTALQANGTHALNLSGLSGQLSTVQMVIQKGPHASRVTLPPAANSSVIFAETDRNNALYYSNGNAWVLIYATGYGSFEDRWSDLTASDAGAFYIETQRSGILSAFPAPLYYWNGSQWLLESGLWVRTQATLAALLATLGRQKSVDAGALAWVSDYAHMLQASLSGSTYSWVRGRGDPEHSDTFQWYGAAPSDAGWHACDGSAVNFLNYDGTLGTRTLPNTGTPFYAKAGSYAPTLTAKVSPTFAGDAQGFTSINITTVAGNNAVLTGPSSITPAGNVSLAGGDPIPNVGLLLYYRQ
jgi:hypothetical protein